MLKRESSFHKNDFNKTQELYRIMINTKDEKDKQKIREQLITDNMKYIEKFVEQNNLADLTDGSFDEDDIMNSAIEVWIEIIDSGRLLEVDNYSQVFTKDFASKIGSKLGIFRNGWGFQFHIPNDRLLDIIGHFMVWAYAFSDDLQYHEFMEFMDEPEIKELTKKFSIFDYKELYTLLRNALVVLDSSNIVSKSGIKKASSILLNRIDSERRREPGSLSTTYDLDERLDCKALVSDILEKLPENQAETLRKRFGIGCNPQTYDQISPGAGESARHRLTAAKKKILECYEQRV